MKTLCVLGLSKVFERQFEKYEKLLNNLNLSHQGIITPAVDPTHFAHLITVVARNDTLLIIFADELNGKTKVPIPGEAHVIRGDRVRNPLARWCPNDRTWFLPTGPGVYALGSYIHFPIGTSVKNCPHWAAMLNHMGIVGRGANV